LIATSAKLSEVDEDALLAYVVPVGIAAASRSGGARFEHLAGCIRIPKARLPDETATVHLQFQPAPFEKCIG
jgi:hypothetical protein